MKRTTDYDDRRPVDSSKAHHMRAPTVSVSIDKGALMEISGAPTGCISPLQQAQKGSASPAWLSCFPACQPLAEGQPTSLSLAGGCGMGAHVTEEVA